MVFYDYIAITSRGPRIDTGIKYGEFDSLELDFEVTSTPVIHGSPVGLQGNLNNGNDSFLFDYQSSRFQFRAGGDPNEINMLSDLVLNQRYIFKGTVDSGTAEFFVDGTSQGTTTAGSISTTLNCYIFDFNPGYQNRVVPMKLYECKMWLSGVLVRDFLPAEDNGVYGLFDTVNEQFYTNSGSGSFTPGTPVSAGSYTVQFNANGGTGTMADQEIDRNVETALSINTFTRADHVFTGWATAPGGAVQYTNGQYVLNIAEADETIILYAVWQYVTPTYTIAYSANGGTGAMAPTIAPVHTPVTLTPCAFIRSGYSFLGWSTNPSGMIQFIDGATVTDLAPRDTTVILYAIWGSVAGFDVILQTNESENNRITKSVKTIATYTGTLRDTTSIIDPVIVIECDLANVTKCNYVTVSAFGRSYFVNNITSVRDGLVEFQCHVDVLSSFAKDIKSNTGIIRRAEHKDLYNLYLNDGSLKSYQDPYILTEPFPQGFSGWGFILAVAGD